MADVDDLFNVFDGGDAGEDELDALHAGVKRAHDEGSEPAAKRVEMEITEESDEDEIGRDMDEDDIRKPPELEASVVLERYDKAKNCVHECVRPSKGQREPERPPQAPAKEYPYVLDPFQAEAIACLERNESVLVSAHTSAGKTTVAEYAIAMSLRNKQRVIYTSPIKALSNQKYRDMADEFKDVGLMTGDVTINPNASCMIMTTEILRSMLYRGSEMCREMAWVVFDEVHYMRDRDRGVVWEETMILLPDTVRFVFLSATIPNSREFAEWICRIKHQPCHLIYTDYRPVPLQHFVFPAGGEGVYLTVDEKGTFREDNFQKAVQSLDKSHESLQKVKNPKAKKLRQNQDQKNDLLKVIRMCADRAFVPVIVFAFSKKDCENNAVTLKNVDLTTEEEKKLIAEVYDNAMATLAQDDKELPQIQSMLPFLVRGIGIHHGGLLPILKEVIEILFQENLIKVLFCTETFAMGVNMPAKTVVFTQVHKWDGIERRTLNSGEFIQMAGRAGRRGKDDRGLTIIMLSDKVEPDTAKEMFLGVPTRLDSQFYLGYNMLLNMLRLEGVDPNYLIERSFSQFQKDRACLALKEKCSHLKVDLQKQDDELVRVQAEAKAELKDPKIDVNSLAAEMFEKNSEIVRLQEELKKIIFSAQHLRTFMNPGRIVEISGPKAGPAAGWGLVIKMVTRKEAVDDVEKDVHLLDVFSRAQEAVVQVPLECVSRVSKVRGNLPKGGDINDAETKEFLGRTLNSILSHEKFRTSGPPELDPVADMKVDTKEFHEARRKLKEAKNALKENQLMDTEKFSLEQRQKYYAPFETRVRVHQLLRETEEKLEAHKNLVMRDDLRNMRRVLRRLGFIDKNNVVLDKGKMACEVSSCDEVLLTEMVFQNVFEGMKSDHIVALCSCLVFDEKSKEEFVMPKGHVELEKAYEKTKGIAHEIAVVMQECKVGIDIEEFVGKLKPQLMSVVLLWVQGKSFKDIMQECELFEGSVVRCMRRLEELLRELACAAQSIGYKELEEKLVEGRTKLRRGIIFSASLYL